MLTVIGDLVADLIVLGGARLERGTDNTAEVRLTRGGSAANVAVAAAPQHPVRFIGRVGDDTLGETLARQLENSGVEVRVQRVGRTGAIVILVDDDGERTMITDRGASAELDTIDDDWWEGSDWVHLPLYGFAAPTTRAALLDMCARVGGRGIPISLDLSSTATMRDLGPDLLAEMLDAIGPSVTFANADEAALADEWMLRPSGVFVVKRGGDPVHVRHGGVTAEVAVERVDDVLDSTGAGDAFAAGYLVAVLAGADALAAAEAGSALAMEALRRPGAL
ncbi:PfkB family carbohydrate kinase [Microbacterium lacus]|uniref:carbohydrate kinase family protein n=1 Tax=Microbacterium lacus TaxID=415217 RepID=UPI00384AAD9A